MSSEIGKFLKELRGEMSLREAGERSGISHTYIRAIEQNKRPGSNTPINPTPETLKRLAKAYNYDYDELLKVAGYIDNNNTVDKKPQNEDFDPEVRSLARDIKDLNPTDKQLLKGLIKSMREKGKKALDE